MLLIFNRLFTRKSAKLNSFYPHNAPSKAIPYLWMDPRRGSNKNGAPVAAAACHQMVALHHPFRFRDIRCPTVGNRNSGKFLTFSAFLVMTNRR
jgi:hypothetical protein